MPGNMQFSTSARRMVLNTYLYAFTQRAAEFTFGNVVEFVPSHSAYEPFATLGAFPMMTQYMGTVNLESTGSFDWAIPQNVYKAASGINRMTYETDQIGAINAYIQGAGLEIPQFLQRKFSYELLLSTNSTTAPTSQYDYLDSPPGSSYGGNNGSNQFVTTADGKPFYSTQHVYPSGCIYQGTQSNILQGNLPATIDASTTIATLSAAILNDIGNVIVPFFHNIYNTNGDFMFGSMNESVMLEFHVPPALKLVFEQLGLNTNSFINMTTNVGARFMARIRCHAYYANCPSIKNNGQYISPQFANTYFVIMRPNYVTPFVGTVFSPLPAQYQSPLGSNGNPPNAQQARNAYQATAALFPDSIGDFGRYAGASTIIDQTFQMQGANAIPQTIEETFTLSPRFRGNIKPVFWQMSAMVVTQAAVGNFPTW